MSKRDGFLRDKITKLYKFESPVQKNIWFSSKNRSVAKDVFDIMKLPLKIIVMPSLDKTDATREYPIDTNYWGKLPILLGFVDAEKYYSVSYTNKRSEHPEVFNIDLYEKGDREIPWRSVMSPEMWDYIVFIADTFLPTKLNFDHVQIDYTVERIKKIAEICKFHESLLNLFLKSVENRLLKNQEEFDQIPLNLFVYANTSIKEMLKEFEEKDPS